tara:strand:+ start:2608 stop:3216 length:609 start_codon:yes stop_codon:yes gene_type:complete
MNNWFNTKQSFENNGILSIDEVPTNVSEWLLNNIPDRKFNDGLAGQINEEYGYDTRPQFIDEFILKKIENPIIQYHLSKVKIIKEPKLALQNLWINLQKKHEFNPLHNHTGILSFIIFLKVPYNLDDEMKVFPQASCEPMASKLSFIVFDSLGEISELNVPVDKSFENRMIMFPAKLQHLVYPFYTSDDYRITCSGNISYFL